MNKLGNQIRISVAKLSEKDLKNSLLTSFMVYQQSIKRDQDPPEGQWFALHDLISSYWGFFGDLDLHIDEMEIKLTTLVKSSSKAQLLNFIEDVGNAYENRLKAEKKLAAAIIASGGSVIEIWITFNQLKY